MLLNVIIAELTKMRKNKMFIISSLIVWIFAVFLIAIDPSFANLTDGWFGVASPLNIVLSIMSGFVITVLIQREYQDNTIINVLTAPVARKEFIITKSVTWFIWHIITLSVTIALVTVSYRLIFSTTFQISEAVRLIVGFGKMGLLSFVTFLPLLWIAIKQRKTFYPTLILALVFAALLIAVADYPIFNFIPWTAVTIVSLSGIQGVGIGTQEIIIGLTSIFTCGIFGLGLACFSFSNQDQ